MLLAFLNVVCISEQVSHTPHPFLASESAVSRWPACPLVSLPHSQAQSCLFSIFYLLMCICLLQGQLKDFVAFLERNRAYIFNGAQLPAPVLKSKPEIPSMPVSTPHAAIANGSGEPCPQSAPRYTFEGDDSWED